MQAPKEVKGPEPKWAAAPENALMPMWGAAANSAAVKKQTAARRAHAEASDPTEFRKLQETAKKNLKQWGERAHALGRVARPLGCQVKVMSGDSLDTARAMAERTGQIPGVLNMANAYTPGGGWPEGMPAQEEDIWARSTAPVQVKTEELDRDGHYTKATSDLINGRYGRVDLDMEPRVAFMDSKHQGYGRSMDDGVFAFFELRSAAIDRRGKHGAPRNKVAMEADGVTYIPLTPEEKREMKQRLKHR